MEVKSAQPAIILSHVFALMWYRALPGRVPKARPDSFRVTASQQDEIILRAIPSREQVRAVLGGSRSRMAPVPEILVSAKARRTRPSDYHEHYVSGPLPHGALWRGRAKGLYVVSPELLFAQLSKTVSFVDLCMIGQELCGTYVMPLDEHGALQTVRDDEGKSRLHKHVPFTTPRRIAAALDQMSGFGPKSKARRALACIGAQSASPMESRLFLAMTMPRRKGGLGIPAPELNREVKLNNEQRRMLRKHHLKCDLYWDNRLAVEYESFERHSSPSEYEETMARATVLRMKGLEYVAMTPGTFYNYDRLMDKVAIIFKVLGIRHRKPVPKRERLQRELIRQLGEAPSI